MENQKLENILNLALEISESDRQRSGQLGVGFYEKERRWELIVKYHGDIKRLQSSVVQVEELIAGYAVITISESLIDTFTQLDEVVLNSCLFSFLTPEHRGSCLISLQT